MKKPNMNRARNMDIDAWRERQINKRTHQLIQEENRAFIQAHGNDSDAELLERIRRRAAELRRMPHPLELSGGLYIRRRLGDWDTLASNLGLEPVGQNRGKKAFLRLRKKGEELYTAERRALKTAKNQNLKEGAGRNLGPGSGSQSRLYWRKNR